MKKSIKKYQWGTFSASGSTPQMVNPGNASLKQYTTTSSSSIPTGATPASGSISDLVKSGSTGGNSSPLGGLDIGGLASSLGGSIAMLINANKKDPNPGRPYKTGTNMIKYQGGTQGAKSKRNMQHIMEQNMAQNAMNFILNANIANIKRNAELNSRVAPKKLEGKKASIKTDTLKTNKPSFIKYQEGNEFLQASKFQKNALDQLNSDIKTPPVEPIAPKRSNIKFSSQDLPANPAPKMVNTYQGNFEEYTPEEYPELFFMKKKGKMGSAIGYGDEYGPGKKEYITSLRDARKKDLKARLEGVEAMIKYDADQKATKDAIASGIPASLTTPTFNKESVKRSIEKQEGGPVFTEANPILYKENIEKETPVTKKQNTTVEKKQSNPYIAFKNMSAADKKAYRAGMASGQDFIVGGRDYKAATPARQKHSERMQRLYEKNPAMYNKLITKVSSFKEGTKELKAENTKKIKGKNGAPDTLYSKKTGRKIAFISDNGEVEKKENKVKANPPVKTEVKSDTTSSKENKGLYQGNKLVEYGTTMGLPALSETTSRFGKKLKAVMKYGPAAIRFLHDAFADKKNKGEVDWTARTGNLIKDITLGTTASSTTRGIKEARKNYKAQEVAAAKETENPVLPSRSKSLKEGMTEGAKGSTVAKIGRYIQDVAGGSPEGKQAKINFKNAQAHKTATDKKFTGSGNGEMGKEGQYYIKGKPVEQKAYINFQRTSRKVGKVNTKEKVEKYRNIHAGFDKKQSEIEYNEKATQKALDDKFTGIGSISKGVGVEGKHYINGVEVSKQEYNANYRKEIREREKQDAEAAKQNVSGSTEGPNVRKPTPVRTEVSTRRRTAAETERMREKGFTDKEGRTPGEFKNWFKQEENRISTQPIPSKKKDNGEDWTQEEWNDEIKRQLGEHSKTKEAYMKAIAENKKAAAEKAKAPETKPEPTPEVKAETPESKKPARASRASRANTAKEEVNDLTNARREAPVENKPESKPSSKSGRKKGTQSEESGPNEAPAASAEAFGLTSNKGKKNSKKANGARLIKYK